MGPSQLPNSPEFGALGTGSDLQLWFFLRQVHPGMLKQSCSSSSRPAARAPGMQQPHSCLPNPPAQPHRSHKHIGICSIGDRSGVTRTGIMQSAVRREPGAGPAPSQRAGTLQPCFSTWCKSARIL